MTRGEYLRRLRTDAGLEVEDIAARLGVSVATVLAWEADIETPEADQLERLAEALGVDAATFNAATDVPVAQGICRAVDLVPDATQAEILEEVGLPPALWRDDDTWVAFLRLAEVAATLSPDQVSALAHQAEICVAQSNPPLPHRGP